MFTLADYGIEEDAETRAARERVLSHINIGEKERQRLIDYCAANIPRDRYLHPRHMRFDVGYDSNPNTGDAPVVISYARGPRVDPWSAVETSSIHRHALGQLADISGLTRTYLGKLNEPSDNDWRRALIATNLNELFSKQKFVNKKKKEAEFLHRMVGNELRAVLTQSYNRHLVSVAVLQPFLAVCDEVGLLATKATITDMRVHLQTYLPIAFQPVSGEFVAIGTCWGNSDFGQGRLRVSHSVMRVTSGSSLVTDDAFSRTHIGRVVEDTDLQLDDQVAIKELEAVAAAIQSTVREAMQPAQVQKIMLAIARAHDEKVPWSKLKDELGKFLTKDEITSVQDMVSSQITDLPPAGVGANGQPLPSRWWVAAALSKLSDAQTDATKAMELKQVAGNYLDVPE